jgi:hypothetical protein
MPKFTEKIYSTGTNLYVNVPRRVSDALGGGGFVKIKGTLNGAPIRSALVPTGGRHRLYISDGIRHAAGAGVGDTVDLILEADREMPEAPTPAPLAEALAVNRPFKEAWERLAPSRRQEILLDLNSLKKPESLQRNIAKLIGRLTRS